ncbi:MULTISPECIES: hypothetical protein [Clostridioides]|uniref:Uncharacterized protein n=1 Tax=Clostridioides difficile TaxID=1496 RepID=A0AAN5VJU2_CLODI|nr:hypothetical protein [Clostridioides difficile]MCC0669293.1 hypothetical protein [Clostridioides sp. ZZV14-6153]MCC0698506.1 hypothetical protein [Clostridioides sp. ZZV15-6383]MCC0728950.1 hypothetical protein [Clostridioides sp. ZZV14-6045]MCC0732955.1 hypothetical protein [Clostridioides sp. ZZV14-6048]MCC0735405.1 hypothetical protein [Clostridioides sp. ZZV14-6009]MCC0740879.1 hypothetical protein [Clostridioides sp. ZZV14-5902]
MKVDLSKIEFLISEATNVNLSLEELNVAKEILNTLNKNAKSISSPIDILVFCKDALRYNPVSEFIYTEL